MKKRNIILAFLLTVSMVLTACGKKKEKSEIAYLKESPNISLIFMINHLLI